MKTAWNVVKILFALLFFFVLGPLLLREVRGIFGLPPDGK